MLTQRPFQNTLNLIKKDKYGAKLVTGNITFNELKALVQQANFTVPNSYNKQEFMIDFVITIASLLTRKQLHQITSRLIEADLKIHFQMI